MLEKPPPASVETEKPVLGSILAGSIDPAQAPAVVKPDDFRLEAQSEDCDDHRRAGRSRRKNSSATCSLSSRWMFLPKTAPELLVHLQAREPAVEQAVAQLLDQEAHAAAGLRVPSPSRLRLLPRDTGRVGLDKLILLLSNLFSNEIVLREITRRCVLCLTCRRAGCSSSFFRVARWAAIGGPVAPAPAGKRYGAAGDFKRNRKSGKENLQGISRSTA